MVIRSRRVVLPEGIAPASIHIENGIIQAIGPFEERADYDAADSVVMPGLVDTHVHINEPGRTQWEGFRSATRKAAAGGVTTLVDMPLNSIPATTSVDGLQAKLDAAQGQCWADVGFWGGVVPGNAEALAPLVKGGVLGFKCFLIDSGVPEFAAVSEGDLRLALPELVAAGSLLLAHAELPGPIEQAKSSIENCDPRKYKTYLTSRPVEAEIEAISLLIRLAQQFPARIHVVHLSAADALPMFRLARKDGLPVTVETCPHYLCLAAEDIPDGATEFKCAPPIRERENAERLWAALGEELIDCVVSDHSPCTPAMKLPESGDFMRAWGGIASLGRGLGMMWPQARRRGYSLEDIVEWMSAKPARLAGLGERKGVIAPGHDADLVVWDPEDRHESAPRVTTFLRGEKIYDRGEFASTPAGRILKRS